MNHPIYRDPSINKSREIFISAVEKNGYENASMSMANIVGKEYGMSVSKILPTIEAMLKSYIVANDIKNAGHILIDVKKEEWSSKTSERTISMIDLGHFNFPFTSGTINIDGKYVSYSYKDEKLMISHDSNGGIFLIEVDAGRPIGEEIQRIGGISESNVSLIYEVLSILLYIATFYTKAKVRSETVPRSQGSKRKSIPKHNVVLLKLIVSINGKKSKGIGEKSTVSWIVRGHWRNQWYAKDGVNKPIFVNPYWKGDGKKQVEKVYKI